MSEGRLRGAILITALVGAGIAGYLTYAHYQPHALACTTGGCETVQESRYAELLGIPVAALGLAAYLTIGASALFRGEIARLAGAAVAIASLLFALYLVYVQAEVIDAWCEWCLASDAVFVLITVLAVLRAASPAEG